MRRCPGTYALQNDSVTNVRGVWAGLIVRL
ncbi:Uncharacterised protein [Bordetella pertussis]|nr:Uncharacterised protein [Bordetella pertussis]